MDVLNKCIEHEKKLIGQIALAVTYANEGEFATDDHWQRFAMGAGVVLHSEWLEKANKNLED